LLNDPRKFTIFSTHPAYHYHYHYHSGLYSSNFYHPATSAFYHHLYNFISCHRG
jgi:hypothetical protein